MPRLPMRSVRPLAAVLTLVAISNTTSAQWGPFGAACDCQPAVAPMAAPVFSQTAMVNPCVTQTVCVNPCPIVQPVQETVYRDVPVTEYRQEARIVKKPVLRTVYEDQKVTAYRQIMVQKTAEVPSVDYQTVTECQPVTVNRSYWRTVQQPVAKGCACDYDRRPTLAGWLNRQSYEMRMAMTPNTINRREFVPNVQAYSVPVQKTVAIPTTRQVTYNVAQLEPYETTQKVARTITEYVDEEVTAYVPFTTTKTVAVGTVTRMAFVGGLGGGTTATAIRPTPERTVEQNVTPKKQTSTKSDGDIKLNSYESDPTDVYPPRPAAEPQPFGGFDKFEQGNVRPEPKDESVDVAGWRPSRHRRSSNTLPPSALPTVAAK
ncbi:MAG: hypothetical protein KF861_06685 [Planctomycetaceae bacterium]|nr:hypothetical protein [Planctomycetaceae bacterium]